MTRRILMIGSLLLAAASLAHATSDDEIKKQLKKQLDRQKRVEHRHGGYWSESRVFFPDQGYPSYWTPERTSQLRSDSSDSRTPEEVQRDIERRWPSLVLPKN